MKTLLTLLFAASLFVVGCGGGGGGSSYSDLQVTEKPSDVWQGTAFHDDGTEEPLICMITPELTVYCATEGNREFDGKVARLVDEKTLRIEYGWMPEIVAGENGPVAGAGVIECEWSPHKFLDCDYLGVAEDGNVESGRLVFSHVADQVDAVHSDRCLLSRRLNQSHVAGTWIDGEGPIPMLSIDRVGRAFGHNASTGCYFSGTVRQVANPRLDPWRNLYRVALLIESCEARGYADFNGKMLQGIAFLDDELLQNDTLRMMAGAKCQEGPAGFTANFRRQ